MVIQVSGLHLAMLDRHLLCASHPAPLGAASGSPATADEQQDEMATVAGCNIFSGAWQKGLARLRNT
jgi:hypothetical protein